MDVEPRPEIIADSLGEQSDGAVRRWVRRRPRLAVALVTLAVVAGSAAAVRSLRDRPPAALTVQGSASDPVDDPWQGGWDGRPTGPVVLSATTTVRRQYASGERVDVTGVAGPGVVRSLAATVAVPQRGSVGVPVRAEVDCAQVVTGGLPDDAYRLTVRTGGPGGRTSATEAGDAGAGWARAVRTACATWTARHDLTLTDLSARVDPTLPQVDLTVTVANGGHTPAQLQTTAQPPTSITLGDTVSEPVPAGGSATTQLTVRLDRCDLVESLAYGSVGFPLLSDRIGLVALAGAPIGAAAAFERPGAGTGPTGVVLSRSAGAALGIAVRQACGDLGQVDAVIPPGGVRYDPVRHDVAVTAVVETAPGRVGSVVLFPESAWPAAVLTPDPLTQSTPVHPDAAGHASVTVHYRAPDAGACSAAGSTLLGVVATLRVPVPAGERELRYSLFLDLLSDPRAPATLCGATGTGGVAGGATAAQPG